MSMRLIDAESLKELFPDNGEGSWTYNATAKAYIDAQPTIQLERPKGEWIHQSKFSRIECDQCGKVFRNSFAPKNFCPNCGADMRGEQE